MRAAPQAGGPVPISARTLTALRWLLAALSVVMVALFLDTAARRLHFSFEYDWIEDGMLASVRHIRSGLPLYSAPGTTFTPYLYTPVYLYVAAALSRVMGISYAPLRLLSILSTLGCFAAIYALVLREQAGRELRRHLAALAAVGLFAACYPVVQGAFDLGRVDMLYLFFVLLAFYVTRFGHPALAALLWVCAFQTKQGVLPIALLALCYDWQRPRRVLLGLGSFVALLAASILWLNHASDGWYNYYVFQTAGGFGWSRAQAAHFVTGDLLGACGIAVLVILAAWFAAPVVGTPLRSRRFCFYTLGSAGMVVFTAYLRAHRGANVNSLLPMYAWVAVLFGLALGRLFAELESDNSPPSRAALATLLLAAGVQLLVHLYSPGEFLPTREEASERRAFEEQLRDIPGPVLVLSHPEDAALAGKPLFAGSESIGAVIDARDRTRSDDLIAQYDALLHGRTVSAVVLDMTADDNLALRAGGHRIWMPDDFLTLYPLRVRANGGGDTRFTSEPRWIYLPCSQQALAQRMDTLVDTTACKKPVTP